jgi:hypothetical protein
MLHIPAGKPPIQIYWKLAKTVKGENEAAEARQLVRS